ncbi:MAG TPA: hypothetical protein ENF26_02945 [Methanomicrobia archaeon]|nr:hypothetical protein [Methanomicrobia archaeon]HEX59089.1 hypothetical protein [Methanomicrobia archaeon]
MTDPMYVYVLWNMLEEARKNARAKKLRLLIIGFDGLDYVLLKEWKQEVPFITELSKKYHLKCLQTDDIGSVSLWTTVYTGKKKEEHRIFEVHQLVKYPFEDAFWHVLSKKGLKVGMVGMPMTFPARKIDGWMLSGFVTPGISEKIFYPREKDIEEVIRITGYQPSFADALHEKGILPHNFQRLSCTGIKEELVEVVEAKIKGAVLLHSRRPVDVLAIGFSFVDHISHLNLEHDRSPRVEKWVYKEVDETVKKIFETFSFDDFLIISDHGWRGNGHTTDAVLLYSNSFGADESIEDHRLAFQIITRV